MMAGLSRLTWPKVRLIGLWGLGGGCTLAVHWAINVHGLNQPSPHTIREDLLHGNMEHRRHVSFSAKLRINRLSTPPACVLGYGGAQKIHFSGGEWQTLSWWPFLNRPQSDIWPLPAMDCNIWSSDPSSGWTLPLPLIKTMKQLNAKLKPCDYRCYSHSPLCPVVVWKLLCSTLICDYLLYLFSE